jgi:Ca2+-binding RTX toxin-like protein
MTDKPSKPTPLTPEEAAQVTGGGIDQTGGVWFMNSFQGTNTAGDDHYVAQTSFFGQTVQMEARIVAAPGETGNDTLIGRSGNDTFEGGGGNNSIDGGVGRDSITAGDGRDTLVGGANSDIIIGGGGNDYIDGGADRDLIDAGDGDDTIVAGGGDDIRAGAGDDVIWYVPGAASGAAQIQGNAGTDTLVLDMRGVTLQDIVAAFGRTYADLGQRPPEIEGDRIKTNGPGVLNIGGETIYVSSIDYITLPSRVTGDDSANVLTGHASSQTLVAEGGNDTIIGAGGHDTVSAGAGDDLAIWTPGDGSDSVDGGTGIDTLRLDRMNITPDQILGAIRVESGAARPTLLADGRIDVGGVTGSIVLDGVTIAFRNLEFIEGPRVTGTAGADNLVGSALGDNVVAGAGDDTILAGYGNDTVQAGDGADVIVWGPQDGADRIDGGAGTDTLRLADSRYSIADVLARITADPGSRTPAMTDDGRIYVQGVTGTLTIDGQAVRFANLEYIEVPKIVATDRAEVVTGSTGAEIVDAGGGDDTVIGGGGSDTVLAGAGQDLIVWASGDGQDSVDGGGGVDTLRIEDTGLSGTALRDAIVPDQGVAPPVLLSDGSVQVFGPGSLTVYGQTVRFTNIEYIVSGDWTWYAGRTS